MRGVLPAADYFPAPSSLAVLSELLSVELKNRRLRTWSERTEIDDVPDGALAIARDRQTNLDDWAVPKMEPYIEKKKALEETQRAEEANRQN